MNAAYTSLAASDAAAAGEKLAEDKPFSLSGGLAAAFATIPVNLAEALGKWADPLGVNVGDVSDQAAVAEDQKVSAGTFGAMAARFDGAAGAFAYLLFILLYFPCTAAIAAVYQESGARWTAFVALWTTGLGYGLATLYYQAATWAAHPASALTWIIGVLAALAAAFLALRWMGQREAEAPLPVAQKA